MSRHFKLDDVLRLPDRPECERLARDLASTGNQLHAWILSRGYDIGRSAVHNWRRHMRRNAPDRDRRMRLHQLIEAVDAEQLDEIEQTIAHLAPDLMRAK